MLQRCDDALYSWDVTCSVLEVESLRTGKTLVLDQIGFAVLDVVEGGKCQTVDNVLERTTDAYEDRLVVLEVRRLLSAGVIEDANYSLPKDEFYTPMIYLQMLADKAKMNAYRDALKKAIKPGMRVLHAGCGLGIFAIWAAQFGAERVWAIDRRPIIEVAKKLALENGVADLIEFSRGDVLDSSLAASINDVDLVISEFIGDEIFDEGILCKHFWMNQLYFKDRLGQYIPRSLSGMAIPIQSSKAFSRLQHKQSNVTEASYLNNIKLSAFEDMVQTLGARNDFSDRLYVSSFKELEQNEYEILGEATPFWEVSFSECNHTLFHNTVKMEITKPGRLDGVLLFFEAALDYSTELSSAPWLPRRHWPQIVYLAENRQNVRSGDSVKLGVAYTGGKGLVVAMKC